mgnify:CR=1 FL=1|tara:strand:- start:1003 stop:1140 length:138 start_codon:yes stop_codon:yes gene_type:complete
MTCECNHCYNERRWNVWYININSIPEIAYMQLRETEKYKLGCKKQ